MGNAANITGPPVGVSLMQGLSSTPASFTGRVRLRTLILIRWVAVAGQSAAILIVFFGFGYGFPLFPTLAAVAVSAGLNIFLTLRYPVSKRLSDTQAGLYLAYDTIQLAVLLYLTGGLHNPFSFLMLAAVTVSAAVLKLRTTMLLGTLLLACISILVFLHLPLPWPGSVHQLSHIYVFGIWTSLVIGMLFFSVNILRVAQEGRRMSDALTETQMALAREQRLSAVGGLAAAAAHELGTPLGTISLVAKELRRELPEEGAYSEDLDLLQSQAERCRDILARLTLRPGQSEAAAHHHLPVMNLLELAVHPHRRGGIAVTVEHDRNLAGETGAKGDAADSADNPQPIVPHSLEFVRGLENLIENAVDFASSKVSVRIGWSAARIVIEVADDGPGFAENVLGALGEPYVSTRREDGGMGLGVFIAMTLLERTGAEIIFTNRREGGARVIVSWERGVLEGATAPAAADAPGQSGEANRG